MLTAVIMIGQGKIPVHFVGVAVDVVALVIVGDGLILEELVPLAVDVEALLIVGYGLVAGVDVVAGRSKIVITRVV